MMPECCWIPCGQSTFSVFMQGTCLHVYSVVLRGIVRFCRAFFCFAGRVYMCTLLFCRAQVYMCILLFCMAHIYMHILWFCRAQFTRVVLQGTYLHVYCNFSGPSLCVCCFARHMFTCVLCCFTGYMFTRVFWCFAAHVYRGIPLFCRVYVYILSFCRAHAHFVVLQGIRLRFVVLQGTCTFCSFAGYTFTFCRFSGHVYTCILLCCWAILVYFVLRGILRFCRVCLHAYSVVLRGIPFIRVNMAHVYSDLIFRVWFLPVCLIVFSFYMCV